MTKPNPTNFAQSRNDRRAACADKSIAAYINETETDFADSLTDLLCDLMH